MINSTLGNKDTLNVWLVDLAGNVAATELGVALLHRIKALVIPAFASTEEAMEWGSSLNSQEHETLLDVQRMSSNAALAEVNSQRMLDLATRSQLIREAAEAFVSDASKRSARALRRTFPCGLGSGNN